MKSLDRSVRTYPLFLMLALALLAAPLASAEPRVKPGGEALGMIGYVVDAVNVGAQTIEVGGQTYQVTTTSQLFDAAGNRISLGGVRGMDSHGIADMVKFTTRSGDEIGELRIVDLGRP